MSDPISPIDEQKIIEEQSSDLAETAAEKEQQHALQDYKQAFKRGSRPSMDVKVSSPFRDYYDGPAFSVSAENTTGPFDILPQHHNFISLLKPCELFVRTLEEGDQKIRISGGLMHVKRDRVIIFLDV